MEILKKDKARTIALLQEILKHSITDIEFEDIKEFNSITEYNFSILKVNILYKDGRKEQIYLKMIKGGKIKESIFCYWSLLYEEFLYNNKNKDKDIVQKAIITQVTSDKSSSCILLTLNAKLNYCAEINLIELKKYFEKNIDYERWLEALEIKDDDILFIGKKMYWNNAIFGI